MMRPVLFLAWLLLAGMVPVGAIVWANWVIAPDQCWSHVVDGWALVAWLAWVWVCFQVGERGILDCP